MAGLAFKISAAPFHMWTPDVYQGTPTPVTAFLATASKMGAFALVIRVMLEPFADIADSWRQIVILLAVVSMVWGSLAAIWQTNIKRLMAYSSIGHMGFALVGVAGSQAGVAGCLVYQPYVIMNLGAFALILSMKRGGEPVEAISDLAGLSRERLPMALALLVIFFSMAGITPLAGFFGKFLVFTAAVEAGFWWLAVIGLLTSVISAFAIRIIKVAFFDDLPEEGTFDDAGFTLRAVYGCRRCRCCCSSWWCRLSWLGQHGCGRLRLTGGQTTADSLGLSQADLPRAGRGGSMTAWARPVMRP